MVAEDFAVAIITTPRKSVGNDLKVVAYTEMKVSTMCLVLVESVFFEGWSKMCEGCVRNTRSPAYLRLGWRQLVDIIEYHNRGLMPPRLYKPVCEEFS